MRHSISTLCFTVNKPVCLELLMQDRVSQKKENKLQSPSQVLMMYFASLTRQQVQALDKLMRSTHSPFLILCLLIVLGKA